MDLYSEEVMTESPGKFLKKERETRNIPLEEISNFTKIREHHLQAIEEERYELLPHTLYVKGYLRGYAKYLSLDPNDIILQYENYLKSLIPPEPVELPQPVPPPRKNARPWFILSLIFAVILFVVLYISNPIQRLTEQKPNPILSFPVSPASAIHQQAGIQTIYPNQKIEISGSEKLKPRDGVTQ
jgi:cytoskeleton protein RodZ